MSDVQTDPGDTSRELAADGALIDRLTADVLEARERAAHLEQALVSSRRIGAAIGILMCSLKVTEEAAFSVLRDASQRSNRKLRDVADDVVLTGDLPAPPRAGVEGRAGSR